MPQSSSRFSRKCYIAPLTKIFLTSSLTIAHRGLRPGCGSKEAAIDAATLRMARANPMDRHDHQFGGPDFPGLAGPLLRLFPVDRNYSGRGLARSRCGRAEPEAC